MGVTQVKGTCWLCKQQETSAKGGEIVETYKNGTVRMPFSVVVLVCASIFDYFQVFVKALCFFEFLFLYKTSLNINFLKLFVKKIRPSATICETTQSKDCDESSKVAVCQLRNL